MGRLAAFLATKVLLIFAVVAIALAFSMVSFAVPALASAMSSAAKWMIGSTAVATMNETQVLRRQNQALQRSNQDLARSNQTLIDQSRDLNSRNQALHQTNIRQTQANRVLTTDNQRLYADNVRLQDQLSSNRRVTSDAARRIGQRAVRTTTRSIAAIPLEAVPLLGVSTIIATTAWEIRDTCRTLDDMAEIQAHLGLEADRSFAARACETVSLQKARVEHYGDMRESECRAEAEAAQKRVFYLAEQARDELVPNLVADAESFDAEIIQAAAEEFDAINVVCDCIVDLTCNPSDLTRR